MATRIELGDISIEVTLKEIKNIHLSVYPPHGAVRISAPAHMSLDTIRVYALTKLGWIKQQQRKLLLQERETPREYLERESHFAWGARYLLRIIEEDRAPSVELAPREMILRVRPGTDQARRGAIVEGWYREEVKRAAPPLIRQWEAIMGVHVASFSVRRMKTRWGSCNHRAGHILLNSELAKKPPACLEYIVVHEMAHLLEPTHNARFVALMDRYMPQWQFVRDQLNRLPVSHEDWVY